METNEQSTESKNSDDFLNVFDALLGEPNKNNIARDIKAYNKQHPNNIAFVGEIYNGEASVWKGQLDITNCEDILKAISEKLNAILNVVDINENKVVVSFNKGKTVLSIDYKNTIKRDIETKRLINIYSKK